MEIPKEILVMLAAATSVEELVNEIHESSTEYKEACLVNNEEQKEKALKQLHGRVHLFILQQMTKGDFNQALKVINDMNSFKKKVDFFKTENN